MKVKCKHEWGDWHHRVPDFKLVYCGSKKWVVGKEAEPVHRRRSAPVSVTVDGDENIGN